LRINAYRELAVANTPKAINTLEKNWIDRHGRLPEPVKNLLTIARIKAEAASNNVSSVEISGQRLIVVQSRQVIEECDPRRKRETRLSRKPKLNHGWHGKARMKKELWKRFQTCLVVS
jgi:transcription-repair coupling factor (superfamily II helicase)